MDIHWISICFFKSVETVSAAQKLLGVQTIGGGVPEQGVVVEGVKGVKYTCMPHEMYENSYKKIGNFLIF